MNWEPVKLVMLSSVVSARSSVHCSEELELELELDEAVSNMLYIYSHARTSNAFRKYMNNMYTRNPKNKT